MTGMVGLVVDRRGTLAAAVSRVADRVRLGEVGAMATFC